MQDGAGGDTASDAGAHSADAAASNNESADANVDAHASTISNDASSPDVSDAGGADAAVAVDAAVDASNDASVIIGAKWATPVCDGVIGATEYGAADNHAASGAQTWYAAWDAAHLYVAVDGANLNEGVVLYVGHTGGGLSAGQAYDGARAQTLPFAADAVVYAKQGYTEVRTPSGGAWGAPSTSAAVLCGSGTAREMVIAWSALGAASFPSAFRWLGYAVSATGYAYAQEPTALPSGFIGQSAIFAKQYHVTSTANGSGTFPFQIVE